MCVISFQGLCLFDVDGNRIQVHLPKADEHTEHLDNTPATPHHAGILVDENVIMEFGGDEGEDAWEHRSLTARGTGGEGRPVFEGAFHSFAEAPSDGYEIRVRPQGGGRLSTTELRRRLPSIRKLASGLGEPTGKHLAALVDIVGGRFSSTRGRTYDWVAPTLPVQADQPPGEEDLGKVAWRVEWHLEVDTGTPVEIAIVPRDGSGDILASVKVMARPMDFDCIIIGNLDESDSNVWPFRRPRPSEHCDGPYCPDNDFKWLYRAFDWDRVERLLETSGVEELPVPRLKKPLPSTALEMLALDTPTCFPGTS